MKMITAIIQPTKLAVVREQLSRIGVEKMTVTDALGYGRQRGQAASWRGIEYQATLLSKVVMEVVVNDDFLEPTLNVLTAAAKSGSTGQIGDGKIFVLPVVETYDIGSGNRGPSAV